MFLYLLELCKRLITRKFAKGFMVGIAVAVVFLMLSTSFSSAFYSSNTAASSGSSGGHIYLVTTTVGGQNSSYFEDVQNGKVVKTWPAPATASGSYLSSSSSGAGQSSGASLGSRNLSSQTNTLLEKFSSFSAATVGRNYSTSMDTHGSGSTFNVTQSYSLTSITLSPTSSNLYVGQTLELKAVWSGGQSPYSYVWNVTQTSSDRVYASYYNNSSSLNSADFNFTPDHPNTYLISLTVNGSTSGSGLSAGAVISVQQQPQSHKDKNNQYSLQNVTLAPSTTVMYLGRPITFVGNWTGSSNVYNYAWVVTTDQNQWKLYYKGDKNQIDNYNVTTDTSTSFTFNPQYGSYGIFYLYLYVTPSTGPGSSYQQDSLVAYAQIVLMPGTPGVSSLTISPSSVNANSEAGVPIIFTGNWTGGTAPYSYVWMVTHKDTIQTPYILQFNSYNYTSKNSATFSFVPSDNGRYYVYLFVDSTSSAAYVMAVSQVDSKKNPEPTVSQVTLTPTTVDSNIGEILNFNANWTGGISPYTYVWYVTTNFPHWQQGFRSFNSVNSTSQPSASFTYIPSSYGIYYLYLFVNNHVGNTPPNNDEDGDDGLAIVATAEIIVLHPSQPLTSSAISISPTITTVGSPINATVESGYGVAPFSYSWAVTTSSGQPAPGDYSTTGNQIVFNTPGTYTVTVTVTDANGVTASLTETVTINSLLSATISVSGLTTLDSGQSATLILTSVGGGITPYKGQWLEEPPLASSFLNLTNQFYISPTDLSAASVSTGILTTTGTWAFEFEITDSTSKVATSAPVTITVNPELSVSLSSPVGTQVGAGSSITFTNITQGGTEPYTYSYSVSPSTGWTQSSNPGNTFTFTSTGNYIVTLSVEDAASSIVSSSLTVTVVSPLTVQVQPQSYSIDPGQVFITLTTTVEYGSGSYTWQWYSGSPGSGVAISGSSGSGATSTYTPTQNGTYYVVFKDSSGQSVTTNGAVVKENQLPIVSLLPSSPTIDTSQSLVLSSSVSGGSGSFSYSWTIGGSQVVVGTATTLSFTEDTAGTYKVWLNVTDTGTSPDYSLSPVSITITVDSSPTVSVSPASATIDLSQSLLLTATVNGGSGLYSYSWTIGGSPSVVGTSSTFSFTESSARTYTVWLNVTDTGTYSPLVVSAKVPIAVNVYPSVSVQPKSATIDSGESITITSTAVDGTGPFSWQWYDSSGKISGASGTGLTASQTFSSADTGVYVVFTDTGTTSGASPTATVASSTVSVVVDGSLSISVQPSSGSIDAGQTITLTSTVSGGTGTFSWSLYTSSNSLINSGTGATASYQFSPTTTTSYYFVFTDTGVTLGATPAATATSNQATITVYTVPTVTVSPSSAIVDTSQSLLLTSSVNGGSGSFSYSWTIGSSSTVLGTKSSYSFTQTTSGTYRVVLTVTDSITSYTFSSTASLTVYVSPSISSQPSSVTIDSGQSITITSTAVGGTGSFSWQWYDSSGKISGASGTGLTASQTFSSADTGVYVVFTDTGTTSGASPAATASSSNVAVTVDNSLTVSTQPSSFTINSGQSVTLTSTVSGGTGTFSWSLYTSLNTRVASGTGATASYQLSPATTTSYYFVFTDTGVSSGATPIATAKSNSATVTVNSAPTVTVTPSSAVIDAGQSVALVSTVSGGSGSFAYSWSINGSSTVVGQSPSYTFSLATPDTYKVWLNVTDTGTTPNYAFSPVSVTITVESALSISSQPTSATIDSGQSISPTSTVSGGTGKYSWQWYDSSGPITGDSGTGSVATATFSSGDTGIYVVFTDTGTSSVATPSSMVKSSVVTVTLDSALSISVQPLSGTIDSGQSITLTSTVTGGTGTYSWSLYTSSNFLVASGTGSKASYLLSPTTTTSYYFVFTDTGVTSGATPVSTLSSSNAPVSVNPPLSPSVSPSSATLTLGQSQTFTSTTSGGSGKYTYAWTISGSTTVVSTTNAYTFSESSTGSYKIWLNVTDVGTTPPYTLSVSVTVQVNPGTLSVTFVTNTPSSGSGSLDVGQSLSLSVTPTISGGVLPYSYQWYLNGTSGGSKIGLSGPATSGTAISHFFAPVGKGTYLFYLQITSSDGQSSTTGAITVTVFAAPSISSQPSSVTIDSGQSITITSTAVGGTGSFSWQWYDSSGKISGASGTGLTASQTFSSADTGVYVVFTDTGTTSGASPSLTATSSKASVTLDSAITISVQPKSTSINSGQSVTLTSTVSGGTGTFSWSLFTSSNSVVASGTGATASYQLSPATTTSYYFVFIDTGVSSGAFPVASATSTSATITVTLAPTVSVSPSSAVLDTGQSVTLASSTSGGTGQFSYFWSIGGSSKVVGTGSTYKFYGTTAGPFVVWLNVTDVGTTPNYQLSPAEVSITVDSVPTVTISPSISSIDSGQSITLTSSVSGGTAQFIYSWSVNGNPMNIVNTATSVSFSEATSGTYVVWLNVTDTGTYSAFVFSTTARVTVYAAPAISVQPTSSTIDSGQSVTLTSTVSGGTGTFSWSLFTSSNSVVASGAGATASYQLSPTTTTSYYFVFTDTGVTLGATPAATATSNQATITVNTQPTVTITPSSSQIDVGQTISLTSSISGGSGSFSYSWSIGGSSAIVGKEKSYSFAGSSARAYKIYLNVTDNSTQYVFSTTVSVVVDPSLSVSVQPTSTIVDAGQSVTLSSTVNGGTGTFSWSLYTSSNSLVTSGTGKVASYAFNPQSNGSYYFVFTDAGVTSGASPLSTAKSNSASVVVNSDPKVTVLSTTVGSGSSATLTATASGGTGVGYAFKWYSNSALTNLLYSGNPFKTPALTSTTTYYVTVVDSTGTVSSTTSVTVTVVSSLTSSSLTVTPATTDVGFAISVTVSSGAGVPPYSYSWTVTLYPSGSASGYYSTSGNKVTFTKAGIYSVTATVKDSAGETASITKTITVNTLPSVTITPSSATIDVGASVTFSNSSTGGTAPTTYGWGYPSGSGITHVGNLFNFTNTGNFTIKLYVNDSLGASGFAVATISVNSQPIIVYSSLNVTISAAATMDSGTSTNISITSITGTGPYTAQLKAEAPGSTTFSVIATTTQFSTFPEKVGTGSLTTIGEWHFVVVATEVDNTGITGTSSPITVNVVNALTSSALSISPTNPDIGSPVSVSVQSGYGTLPFVYLWTVTLSGGGSASGDYTSSGNQITFNTGGAYSVTVKVVDEDGLSASISAIITVNAPLSITISAVTPTTVDNGQTVTFSNSVSGGTGTYTVGYSVSSLGGGIKFGAYSISGNTITFSLAGQYDVSSVVTDSLGDTVTSTNSITVTVNALPTVSISPSSTTIDTGNSVTFTNTTVNGTQPYTYIWSYPSGQGITQAGNTFTFADTGNFTITLTVVDSVGVVASSSALITVNPSPIIVLQPGSSSGVQSATNSSQYGSGLQPLIQEQKKTFGGSSDPTITLDQGTPWVVTVQSGTGTPPFTFSWIVNYSSNNTPAKDYTLGSSNSNYVDNVLTFTGTGNYFVFIKVEDKYGATSTETVGIDVSSPLVVNFTIQATASSLDVGNSTSLSSTLKIKGGTPSYSYQWYRNGTSSGDKISGTNASGRFNNSTLSLLQTPTVPGNYTYYLVITDSAYSPASNSTLLLVTVNRLPTTSSIVISPTSTVIDGLINATVKPGYGTAPFNYTWTVAPENGSSSPVTYYGHQIGLSQSGNYTLSLKLRDSDGRVAYNNTTVKIYSSSLVIVRITSPSSVPTIDAGQSQSITGSFGGGSGSYEYQWVLQNSSTPSAPNTGYTSGASPQSYTFTSSTSGTFYVFLYVKDTIVGDTGDVYQEVKVNGDIAQSSISISPATTSVGSPVVASVESGYGTPPFSYSWTVTLSNGGSATGDYNTSGNQVTFSKSGNYIVKVAVSDSYSSATSTSYNVAVSAIISLTASISSYPSAGVTAIDVNHAQVFQATVLGGTGSYSYSWGIGGVSGIVGNSSTYSLNVSTPGLYKIWFNVTEGNSSAKASPLTIIVNPLPKASFGVTGTIQTDVGQSINGNVVGGTPPYRYSWLVGMYPSGGSAAGDYTISGTAITFSARGNYTVEFIATDADGATASVTVTFVVNSQLSGSLSLTNPLSSVIDRGNSSLLNVSISGGSGAFSYQWYVQLPGTTSFQVVAGAVNSTYRFVTSSATLPGIYLFYVNVTDINTDPAYVHSNIISVTVLTKLIYGVTFSETGLPLGTKWFVNITNGNTYSSVSNNINFLEPNGTYSYSISTGNKTYKLSSQSVSSFSFTVSGSTVSQSLVFLPVVYWVTFSESGLRTGTEWFVNLSNGQSYSSTFSVITFTLSNGTFSYTLATANKQYKPVVFSSLFTVAGSPTSDSVQFSLLSYNVSFSQSGLPLGTMWFVNLSSGQTYNSTGGSLEFVQPNGTYSYIIETSNKIYFSYGGTFTVSGAPTFERITFSPFLYNISFPETGLPSGMKWNVTLVSTSGNVTRSSTGSIFFNEVNGTYNFTIGGLAGYKTQDYQITVVVNGSNFKNTITWTAVTYPVTVIETGLAAGATWSVTVTTITQSGQENVQTINSTTDSITFYVTNGSYSYVVTLPQGYQGTPVRGSITVVGDAVTTSLKVTPLPNYLLISIIIAAIAVIVAVLVFYIMVSRKSLFKREGSPLKIKKVKGNK